jgi:hypothetical protein
MKSTFYQNKIAVTQMHLKEHQDNFIDSHNKEIVILDYLITSKQLIELFRNG